MQCKRNAVAYSQAVVGSFLGLRMRCLFVCLKFKTKRILLLQTFYGFTVK